MSRPYSTPYRSLEQIPQIRPQIFTQCGLCQKKNHKSLMQSSRVLLFQICDQIDEYRTLMPPGFFYSHHRVRVLHVKNWQTNSIHMAPILVFRPAKLRNKVPSCNLGLGEEGPASLGKISNPSRPCRTPAKRRYHSKQPGRRSPPFSGIGVLTCIRNSSGFADPQGDREITPSKYE